MILGKILEEVFPAQENAETQAGTYEHFFAGNAFGRSLSHVES